MKNTHQERDLESPSTPNVRNRGENGQVGQKDTLAKGGVWDPELEPHLTCLLITKNPHLEWFYNPKWEGLRLSINSPHGRT